MFYSTHLKTACDKHRHYYRIDKFCITWYEFDYKHWASILREVKSKFCIHKIWKPFNLIWKAKHKSFVDVDVTDRKRSCNHFQSSKCFIYFKFALIFTSGFVYKAGFCLANVNSRLFKWVATYHANSTSRNRHRKYTNFWRSVFITILHKAILH